jgi:hypothetical protein
VIASGEQDPLVDRIRDLHQTATRTESEVKWVDLLAVRLGGILQEVARGLQAE